MFEFFFSLGFFFLHRLRIIELNEYNPVVSLILRYLICKNESVEDEDENYIDINKDDNDNEDDEYDEDQQGTK